MDYKGYTAKVEFDEDAKIFHGEVIDLSDVITFQSENAGELEKEFQLSVDDYLDFCKEIGRDPEKSFSGKLVLRMSKKLHRKLFTDAAMEDVSLNEYINRKLVAPKKRGIIRHQERPAMRKVRPTTAIRHAVSGVHKVRKSNAVGRTQLV